jgi:hypothetical protein
MVTKLARGFLLLQGTAFFSLGVWFLIDPMIMASAIELVPQSQAGFAELRATYGGLEVALGLFLLATSFRASWSEIGLWLLLSCYGGITAGRIVGILLDQPEDTFILQLLGFEATSLLLTILLLFAQKQVSRQSK